MSAIGESEESPKKTAKVKEDQVKNMVKKLAPSNSVKKNARDRSISNNSMDFQKNTNTNKSKSKLAKNLDSGANSPD